MGWVRLEDEGMLDGDTGRWRVRTKEERAVWEEEKWAEAMERAGGGTPLRWRMMERKVVMLPARRGTKPQPVMFAWWGSSFALRRKAWGAGVEAIALAMALGVPVVRAAVRGQRCAERHRGASEREKEKTKVMDDWGPHLESCAIKVLHQRHDKTKDQACYELETILRELAKEVSKEKGLAPDQSVVHRRNADGERIVGDVYVLDEHGNHIFVDIGWQGVALKGDATKVVFAKPAADFVFDRKEQHWADLRVDEVGKRMRFIPLAVSSVGRVAQRTDGG
jgi:hypothetical protein